jgi:hypothetical protein
LHAHHAVGGKAKRAQPGGNAPDDAIGLRVVELPRFAVGEMRAVVRIGERDGVGIADGGAAEQIVERGARVTGRADDHVAFSAHQVSGR